jgi:hypothetical protein
MTRISLSVSPLPTYSINHQRERKYGIAVVTEGRLSGYSSDSPLIIIIRFGIHHNPARGGHIRYP